MKVAFDIGGVLSKYPVLFRKFCMTLQSGSIEVYVITDMHDREKTLAMLKDNGFGFIPEERVLNSDYAKYGDMCKAVLLKEHAIDMLIDDFPGYVQWDSSFGPAPVRLLSQPDPFKPYWSEDWKTDPKDGDFGRRVFTKDTVCND